VAPLSSNTVNVVRNGNPRLTLAKSVLPTSGAGPGSTVNWTLTLTNAGNAPATAVTVTDPVPARTIFGGSLSASVGTATFDAVNNRVVFDVGTLAAGASATLGFATTIGDLPAGGTSIVNVATASAGNAASTTATATTSASAAPVLELSTQGPAQSAYPAATLTAAANGTLLFVNDTTQLAVGQSIAVGGTVTLVTAVNGTSLTVGTPVAAPVGTPVIAGIQYAMSVTNSGNSVATNVAVSDALPAGSTFVAASDGGSFSAGVVTWALGSIDPGASRTIYVTLIPGGPGALTNVASASCTACVVADASADTSVGGLRVTKRTSTPIASAGGTATYVIDVVNTSAAPIGAVTVDDTLPSGFTYASTTSIVNDGAAVGASTSPASGDVIAVWGTFTVASGKTLTITFVANIAASVGAASYQNAAGAAPVANTLAFDPLSTTADDVTVLAANTGLLQGRVYQDNDSNSAFDPLVDTPIAGVGITIVDATATTYTLTTDADGLYSRVVAAGSASVDVDDTTLPAGLVTGATFSDPATVTVPDGGSVTHDVGYVVAANAPDLAIVKTHTGNFAQGLVGAAFTIVVSNVGGGATAGQVSVTDTLPAGLTATGMTGTGWTCDLPTSTCTRSDALVASSSYPAITLTVDVAANAAATVTNTAAVGGGGDVNSANNSSSDAATVTATPLVPDLAIAKTHTGNFAQGQVGATYALTVSNVGTGPTSGLVTVSDTLPAGLTATGASGTGWTCSIGAAVSCTRSDALTASASYPVITLTVDVAANAAASITNTATVAGAGDTNPANDSSSNTATVTVTTPPVPDLAIVKTHAGSFVRGHGGSTYAIVVSNTGTGPTAGTVTVTDALPAGLTATSISGAGWSCSLATLTCTRADALAAGTSYPPIAMAVVVAADAPSSITNVASVAGGGDANAANNASADAVTVRSGPVATPVPVPVSGSALAVLAVLLALTTLIMRRRSTSSS
jgi:uncharacterized repeat protein (TIGR01451 family)